MVQPASKYYIEIKGLSTGKHDFTFDIDHDFFSLFEGSEVEKGRLTAFVTINKTPAITALQAHIKGSVTVECDRCLDELELQVDNQSEAIVKYASQEEEDLNEDEGIIYVNPVKNEIELAQYFFDTIILSLPLQRVHPNGECNQEMMEKLASLRIN